ncbi:hypothetical protein U1Q18_006252 [Sarracenia purpurea var. burkii]
MDASFAPKRPFDSSDPPSSTTAAGTASFTKRRHHLHQPPSYSASPSSITSRPPPPLFKLAAGEILFRILCPSAKTGGVIGKGGAVIRQLREETGARIRIDDSVSGCEERVILIVADSTRKDTSAIEAKQNTDNVDSIGGEFAESSSNSISEDEGSQAQQALVRVFERILKVDEERNGVSAENGNGEGNKEGGSNKGGGDGATPQGPVVCRLLAPSNQVGCVLGRGGKIVEKIRHDSGAQVRVFPKDQIPACAYPGDELIQIGIKHCD